MNSFDFDRDIGPKPGDLIMGKDYPLFDKVVRLHPQDDSDTLIAPRKISLYLEDLDISLPLNLSLRTSSGSLAGSFIPYGGGAKISIEDMGFWTRMGKLSRLSFPSIKTRKFGRQRMELRIASDEDELEEVGVTVPIPEEEKGFDFPELNEKPKDIFSRLRVIIKVPGEQIPAEAENFRKLRKAAIYEGKVSTGELEDGAVVIEEFYPTETGPLPYDYHLKKNFFNDLAEVGLPLDYFREFAQVWGRDGNLQLRLPYGKRMLEPTMSFYLAAPTEKSVENLRFIKE